MQKNYLLALLSAFLLWLAWPPIPYTGPLLLVALVPLFIAVENVITSDFLKKGSKIFLICGLAFVIWNTSCIYWVFNSLNAIMPAWVAGLLSLIPFCLAALLMTISFWLYYRLRRITTFVWSYIGLTCFWITYEYLHQTWDLAFPWMTLGNGFASTHQLVQWYEWTGVYGGTYWILMSNILAFALYRASQNKVGTKTKRLLIARLALHILLPVLVSLWMYYRYKEHNNPANIVVVQPNIDPYEKFGTIPPAQQVQTLLRLSDSVGQPNTEYFIWPETAIPEDTEEENIRTNYNFITIQSFLRKYKNGNVLSGISSFALYDSAKTTTSAFDSRYAKYADLFNAAVQIENSAKVQFYHKSKLVPGPEQIPFSSLTFLKPLFAGFGGGGSYGKQEVPSVFYSQSGIGAAPVICYESVWGEWVAKSVRGGAQFIAIVTNDAWWGNTAGKDQHFDYAKLRAIETRRWVARAANTGISGFINQRGDIVKQSAWWVPTALKADINLNDELTFYVKHEDYIAVIACSGSGMFFIFLVISIFKKRKAGANQVT